MIELRGKMSDAMFWEVHQCVCESRDGEPATVERVAVSPEGYLPNGGYLGALARGERMYRIDTSYRDTYVRTTATIADLRRALAR